MNPNMEAWLNYNLNLNNYEHTDMRTHIGSIHMLERLNWNQQVDEFRTYQECCNILVLLFHLIKVKWSTKIWSKLGF